MGTLRVVAALGALACSSRRTYGALLPRSLVIASVSPEGEKFDLPGRCLDVVQERPSFNP